MAIITCIHNIYMYETICTYNTPHTRHAHEWLDLKNTQYYNKEVNIIGKQDDV